MNSGENFEIRQARERRYSLDSKSTPEEITLRIPSSAQVEQFQAKIIETFNHYGAVVIEFSQAEEPNIQLLCFKKIFGDTLTHDRADEDMVAEIAVSEKFQGYLGTSNAEHPFHTDGAYDDNPPKAMALRCEVPAAEGGISKIADGQAIYQYLSANHPDLLRALFASDALCVERAGRKSCQPVFKIENGRVFIRYRSDKTSTTSTDPLVKKAMEEIKKFLEDKENYMAFVLKEKQVLITDNTRILHARTAFPKNEPRKMHRLFFIGDSATANKLKFGFSER